MRSNTKRLLALLLFALSLAFANAQQEDFGTRWGLGLSGDISKDIGWSLEMQQRFDNNSLKNDRSLVQGSLKYELIDWLRLGAGYRASYIYKTNNSNELKHRYHLDATARAKFDRLKLSYRSRWQYGVNDFNTSQVNEAILRQRLQLVYDVFGLPIEPSLSYEAFSEMNSGKQGVFHAYRFIGGLSYAFSKDFSVELYYLHDQEVNTAKAKENHVLGCSLTYSF